MRSIDIKTIENSVVIIGNDSLDDDEVEKQILKLCANEKDMRRIVDFVPEAFGYVLRSHMKQAVVLSNKFGARDKEGEFVMIDLALEPIWKDAIMLGQKLYQEGPRDLFKSVSLKSAVINTVNNALNGGANLDGATISPTMMLGIMAEDYQNPLSDSPQKKAWWRILGFA